MVDDLAAAIVEGKEAGANIHEAYKSHELCLAIDRSIETGGCLDYVGDETLARM